ncbi:Colicin-E2 immunity protein [compost metagenome]
MELKASLKEYTASEFQTLVNKIWAVDLPKQDHDELINHFDRIVGHPQGADLLFYPDDRFSSNSAAGVVQLVRGWHQKQGIAAFKEEALPVLSPSLPMSPITRGYAEVQRIAADVAVSDQAVETAFAAFEQSTSHLRSEAGAQLDISSQESSIRTLERTQREALNTIRKFAFWKWRIESVKRSVQSSLRFARTDQGQWQSIAYQINATYNQYLARLTVINPRHQRVNEEAESLLNIAQEQLISSRQLAKLGPAHVAFVINGILDFIDNRPAVLLQGEPSALEFLQQVELQKSLRSAVAEFTWQDASGTSRKTIERAPVLNFGFSSRADTQVFGLSVPLSELMPIEGEAWQSLAQSGAEVDVPFRMGSTVVTVAPGSQLLGIEGVKSMSQVYVAASQASNSTLKVPVKLARQEQGAQSFSFTADGTAPVTICWSNAPSLGNSQLRDPAQSNPLSFIQSPPVPILEPLSDNKGAHFDDYIVVFPAEARLNPVYVMLRNRQEYPA